MHTTAFEGLLLSGERIVWSGQPAQGLRLTAKDWLMIPFSLVFLAFSIFWETKVAGIPNSPLIMQLWGIPFILVGVYLVGGRFVVDAWARKHTTYAVSDKRVLIRRTSPRAKFTAVLLAQLPTLEFTEDRGGRGTIRFGQSESSGNRSFAAWTPALDPTPQFIAIEDAQKVLALIQSRAGRRD